MIPLNWSSEINQDSEPNLAVNPARPSQIVATAFTWDNFQGGSVSYPPGPAMTGNLASVYVSTNGGMKWTLSAIVPSTAGPNASGFAPPTFDITPRFGGTSGVLYAGILKNSSTNLEILRTADLSAVMTPPLVDRPNPDQPYIQATSVIGPVWSPDINKDRVYVPNNDWSFSPPAQALDFSLDAATAAAPAGFNTIQLDNRPRSTLDPPSIRLAIHPTGVVYALVHHALGSSTCDLVILRDDNWGSGPPAFHGLLDPPVPTGDGQAGLRILRGFSVSSSYLGLQRVWSDPAIAVDASDSRRVFIAWADDSGAGGHSLHLMRSLDSGATWSADLRTIAGATHPGLAITSRGVGGFLYQQLTGAPGAQKWVTVLETTTNDFGTITTYPLASTAADSPAQQFDPYLGDYDHLMAVGKDFYGVFSASNYPDLANFPSGVSYQRHHNFGTKQLFANDGASAVVPSIDPFFFKLVAVPPESDFYVRDWTDNPSSADTGVEPSTNPVFFSHSDVWNQRSDVAPTFDANDRPIHEDPRAGTGVAGRNWAFCRIHRNASGTTETVTAHFLVSEFGTGSSYQDAALTADPTIPFAASSMVETMTAGYRWQLGPTSSTHVCMAVEISTMTDPYAPPSLLGRTPGWPTSDLMIINDNNKAQRNMGVYTTGRAGHASFYAVVHNAATQKRDVMLEYGLAFDKRLANAEIEVVGGQRKAFRSGDTLTFGGMEPGENRWLGITLELASLGEQAPMVVFYEMIGRTPINGFAIVSQPAPVPDVIRSNLVQHEIGMARIAAGFGIHHAEEEAKAAKRLLDEKVIRSDTYLEFMKSGLPEWHTLYSTLLDSQTAPDAFGGTEALDDIDKAVASTQVDMVCSAHGRFLHKLDSLMTMVQLTRGDPADILLNVRWQKDMYREREQLRYLRCAPTLLERSARFIDYYPQRKVRNDDFPVLIRDLLDCYRATAEALEDSKPQLKTLVAGLAQEKQDLRALQHAHRAYLVELSRT